MICYGYIGDVFKKYCRQCEGVRDYKIESELVRHTDRECWAGAGLPVTRDKCSGCGATGPAGIPSELVGGF